MSAKKFFFVFSILSITVEMVVAIANYHFDYYGVFHVEKNIIESNSLNERFTKIKYLLTGDNALKYDSYLWGSSKVMKGDTKLISCKTYNLGASAGMTEDCLEQLKILINNKKNVNTIYIGIDDASYYRNYSLIANNAGWVSYKDELNRDIETYSSYLLTPSNLKRVAEEETQFQGINYLGENGMFAVPFQLENGIEENVMQHVKGQKFLEPTIFEKDPKEFFNCINNIKRIKEICDKNGIQMKVFFNPHHMTTYLANDMELMNRFKKELVKISPFWDFSGVNYVTANNYFWYETSHPRAFICDKILDTVSGQNKITWVPDFGVYVTPDNVDAFCEKAVRDREAYDPDHEQWVPSAEERKILTKRVNYPW